MIQTHGVAVHYGATTILEHVDLAVDAGERVCLIGRNGAGKTTLLRVLAGELVPDAGNCSRQPHLVVERLAQDVPVMPVGDRVRDVVVPPLDDPGGAADDFAWQQARQRAEVLLSQFSVDPDALFAELSGGQQRRVLLVRALIRDADLLLLDEPTNHLDIAAIAHLEESLLTRNRNKGLLFISHDRLFLQRLATRIVLLDRGRITSYPGDYATFVRRRQAELEVENTDWQLFDRKLAQEEVWIRKGVQARRTRNEGRVRALEALRRQRQERRARQGIARFSLQEAEQSGRLVLAVEKLCYRYDERPCIDNFSTIVLRGDKVGLIGPNGCGKTTLLRLMIGLLTPNAGVVRLGTRLDVAWFDQMREQLDPEKSVWECVAEGSDRVVIGGQSRHVMGYLAEFLFAPERARSPVKTLSGGERNRLLLARLFTRPTNLLVMDEPTNDLDQETMELLEEKLINYTGTLLLVSHDRAFLDNVVTSVLSFDSDGVLREYPGGYSDWQRQRVDLRSDPVVSAPAVRKGDTKSPPPTPERVRRERPVVRMSFREQRELETLPERIEELEQEQSTVQQQLADPALYQSLSQSASEQVETLNALRARLAGIEQELEQGYQRWHELEVRKQELEGGLSEPR
jgi:ATP-binding cassette subfamily F protein uup